MTVVYHLCGYDKTTERLAAEFPIPTRFLPTVRTFVEPVPDDDDLVLPYALTVGAVVRLAERSPPPPVEPAQALRPSDITIRTACHC